MHELELFTVITSEITYLAGIVALVLAGIWAWQGKWRYCACAFIVGIAAGFAHLLG